jgi:hypothetical protein
MSRSVIPSRYHPGSWHEGTAYDIRLHIEGRDTYPNNFKCWVEIRNRRTKEIHIARGNGKFIGNFSPIWVRFKKGSFQVSELLREEKEL